MSNFNSYAGEAIRSREDRFKELMNSAEDIKIRGIYAEKSPGPVMLKELMQGSYSNIRLIKMSTSFI